MRLIVLIVMNVYGFITLNECSNPGPLTDEIPPGKGIAWLYPGDEGIEDHPGVVFTENFEIGGMDDLRARWGHMSNKDGKVMSFSHDVPEGSAGIRSLQMTATRDENSGGELYKTFEEGWDTIHLRYYTKLAEDHGSHHHFVSLRGFIDPLPYPVGAAGKLAENRFGVSMSPFMYEINSGESKIQAPPGIWNFYAYWPEMRSWQTPEGKPDGRPNPYYGNSFQPEQPAIVPRDEWVCIEVMLKMNSSADKKDGELALWVNGEPIVHFAPGKPVGYWRAGSFRNDPGHPDAAPFEGFRWRQDLDLKVNVLRLQHYISGTSFNRSQAWAENNPDKLINTEQATVWFDNVIMATEYIGPLRKKLCIP